MEKDILLQDMVFIAEHRTTGKRVEFTLWDLEACQGDIYINSINYDNCNNIDINIDDCNYIFRLKRDDEDETGLVRPREIASVRAVSEYQLKVEFVDGDVFEVSLQQLFDSVREQEGVIVPFEEFKVTRSRIVWGDYFSLGYCELERWHYLTKNRGNVYGKL